MFILESFLEIARNTPNRPAARLSSQILTYGELDWRSNLLGRTLRQLFSLEPGHPIVLALPNCLEYVECFLAAVKAGAPVAPLNPAQTPQYTLDLINRIQPKVIITTRVLLESLRQAAEHEEDSTWQRPPATSLNTGEVVAVAGVSTPFVHYYQLFSHPGINHAEVRQPIAPGLRDSDLFYLAPTSGSTGRPKIVLRSHHSWANSFKAIARGFNLTREDNFVLPAPLYYSASLYSLLQALSIGARAEILPAFQPAAVLAALARSTACFMAPSQYQALLRSGYRLNTGVKEQCATDRPLKMISAGSKLSPAVREGLTTTFPLAQIYEYYGATELSFVSVLSPADGTCKPESVGKPLPQVNLRLVDHVEGRPIPLHSRVLGQVQVQSPWLANGYLDSPEAENAVFKDYWAGVGDLGWLDEDGFLYLAGRAEGLINRAGEKIPAAEVEAALLRHPLVAEAAVVPLPDNLRGEVPAAIIVPVPGANLTESQLRIYCRQELPRSRRPVVFLLAVELPRSSTGKVELQTAGDLLAARLRLKQRQM